MKKELKLKGNFLGPVEIDGRPYEGEFWVNINNIQSVGGDSCRAYIHMADNKTMVTETPTNMFTNAQLRYNRDQEIPQYGKVCKDYRSIGYDYYGCQDYSLEDYNPVFMGNFYCNVDGKILLLPVYHVPVLKVYDIKKFRGWTNSRFLKSGTPENRAYLEECSKWVTPTIAIKRNEVNHLFEHSYIGKVHNTKKDDLLKNIKEWETLRDVATTKKDRKYLKLQLKVLISKYKSTPDFIEKEAGYGRLYPMVKREDYEKVLNNLACSE